MINLNSVYNKINDTYNTYIIRDVLQCYENIVIKHHYFKLDLEKTVHLLKILYDYKKSGKILNNKNSSNNIEINTNKLNNIYEIFVKNGQLHMSAKKVANASKSYKNAKTRK